MNFASARAARVGRPTSERTVIPLHPDDEDDTTSDQKVAFIDHTQDAEAGGAGSPLRFTGHDGPHWALVVTRGDSPQQRSSHGSQTHRHPHSKTSANVSAEPTGSGLVDSCRGPVERNGRVGCVLSNQIDHGFQELNLIVRVPQATADSDALPCVGLQCTADDRFHVVASIETDQAGLDPNTMHGELSQPHLDRLGNRLGVPWSGHPRRVESDHEDAWRGIGVHL